MKNKLIALLKTLFANKGFNAKELEGFADIVIAQNTLTEDSTDQDLQTAADGAKPTADFVQSVASRQVTDVKKPKPVEPKPADPSDDPKHDEDMPAWAKALAKSVENIGQGLQAISTEKVTNTRRDQFITSMKGTSEDYQKRELKRFDRMKFEKDEDFDAFLEETKDDHTAAVQEEADKGSNNGRPAGGSGGQQESTKVAPAVAAFIAKQNEARKTAASSESVQK